MTETAAVPRFYVDTNVFIYAVEGSSDIAGLLQEFFGLLKMRKGFAVTSELTLAEVMVGAAAVHRRIYLNLMIWSRIFDLHPVSRDILLDTADYRKAGKSKLPDAIHVVTAIRANCRIILSRDQRLKLPVGYAVVPPDRDNLSRLIRELS